MIDSMSRTFGSVSARFHYGKLSAICIAAIVLLFLMFWQLDSVPPPWWDEGWTLTVARTWVERGFYGRLLNGQLAAPGLEAAFTVTAPVALSLRLFGVGFWQGRLVGVLYTLGTLALLWYLTREIYNQAVAAGALFVLAFMSNYPDINAFLNGRQVLGDMPVVFYLLAGYACFIWAWRRSVGAILPGMLFWGLALITKGQTLPFWFVSLTIPMLITVIERRWRPFGLILAMLAGSWIVSKLLLQIETMLLSGHSVSGDALTGLTEAVVFVPTVAARTYAFQIVLFVGLPIILGLAYAAWQYLGERRRHMVDSAPHAVRLMLFLLSGSWAAWYLLLSNGGPRYLASPNVLAAMFVAAMLYDGTSHYSIQATVMRATELLKLRHFGRSNFSALFLTVLVVLMVGSTILVYFVILWPAGNAAVETAEFLNTQTAPDALIETYDSELFVLLQRRYHYPPDQVHVERVLHYGQDENIPVDYDPLSVAPDYLVVGTISSVWHMYDGVIKSGAFRLVKTLGNYEVYERVH
jgi:hypothetical protein